MALDYEIGRDIQQHLSMDKKAQSEDTLVASEGKVVVELSENQLVTFVRLDDGQPLTETQRKLAFRVRGHRVKFASNAYFFAEGDEPLYRSAQFGEFRLNERGELLLTGLLDAQFTRLGPASKDH